MRPPVRDHVLTVVDDIADRDRLLGIGKERDEDTYEALLGAMAEQGGELGVLAAHHARELGFHASVRASAARLDAGKTAFGGELLAPGDGDPPALEASSVPA